MTQGEREAWLRRTITRISGRPAHEVALEADLEEAVGLDSLGRLELLAETEERYDFLFDDEALSTATTIGRMLRAIDRHMADADTEPA